MSALIELRGAAFGYGHEPIVRGVDLTVAAGDLIGVLGPNGAGKTTLFRGLLGLIEPLEGEVRRSTRRIGYVPQREALDRIYPVTVDEVVQMGASGRLKGWRTLPRAERERARACLEHVGLEDQRRRPFGELSGGQRQRALLARALMVEPELLLLDEPTSGVDRAATERILALLRELHARGTSVLLVSHELALVRGFVDSVVWVADGRVTAVGLDALYEDETLGRLFVGGVS